MGLLYQNVDEVSKLMHRSLVISLVLL